MKIIFVFEMRLVTVQQFYQLLRRFLRPESLMVVFENLIVTGDFFGRF